MPRGFTVTNSASVAESTLTQQTQELMAQDQVRSLFHELEASHKTAQRQEILINPNGSTGKANELPS